MSDADRGFARLAAVREILYELANAPAAPSPTANGYARRLTRQQGAARTALTMLDKAMEEIGLPVETGV